MKPDSTTAADPAILGRAVAAARRARRLTQQDLCDRTGIAYSTLTKIERGAIKKPNVFTVLQIAEATDMQVEDLLKGSRPRPVANPHTPAKAATATPASAADSAGTAISFVYFDLHQTLIDTVYGLLPFLAARAGCPPSKLENLLRRMDDTLCLGKLPVEDLDRLIAAEIGQADFKWLDFYIQHASADKSMIRALEKVSQHCRVGLLTNTFPGMVAALSDNGFLPKRFEIIVDSSVVGKLKPDRDMYEYARKQAGVEPGEILLVDDQFINIASALACGWHGLWLDDPARADIEGRLQQAIGF